MSAVIELLWGDAVLCHELLGAGARFVIGGAASADFVAPVATHVVCVGAQGAETRLEVGGTSRPVSASECIALGPLTLRVRASVAEKRRFGSFAWLFDVGGLFLVMLYAGLATVFTLPFVPTRASAETVLQDSLPRMRSFGFSIELDDGDAAFPTPSPARPTTPGHAIFAETKARLPGPRVRNRGLAVPPPEADERRGGTGARAKNDEGQIGNRYAPRLVGTWAMRDRAASRLAKAHPVQWRSWSFSLARPEEVAEEELTAEWGEEEESGDDDQDVVGNMFGDEPIDPLGSGLGVQGSGAGGGGDAKHLGTGKRNHGHGIGWSSNDGRGVSDQARFRRDVGLATHVASAPSLATGVAPEVVERVVARAHGHFRACGANGNTLEFDIGVDGKASRASTADACVRRVLSGLEFLPAGKITTRARVRIGS